MTSETKTTPTSDKKQTENEGELSLLGKAFDFVLYVVVVLVILGIAVRWFPRMDALVTAVVIHCISAFMILHVSLSKTQRSHIQKASYHQINYKLFSPFALLFSFIAICYLLNGDGLRPLIFIGSKNASLVDFSIFGIDNVLRVILWDVPEVYGIQAGPITHNTNNLYIATFVFMFRLLIGLSLIKMLILLARK